MRGQPISKGINNVIVFYKRPAKAVFDLLGQ